MGDRREMSDSEEAYKSHLVTEICDISSNLEKGHCCAHQRHHHFHLSDKKPFFDWYLVLRVDENAGLDIVRKNYLRLALLIHPDKNKHPKADMAFKLISEAYACLSDNTARTSFNVEREKKNKICTKCCIRCNNIIANPEESDRLSPSNSKPRGGKGTRVFRSAGMLQRMKNLRARFAEEAHVIENCLKSNSSGKELPTFNPNDYLSQGYPHHSRANNHKKNMGNFRHFMSKDHRVGEALSVKNA